MSIARPQACSDSEPEPWNPLRGEASGVVGSVHPVREPAAFERAHRVPQWREQPPVAGDGAEDRHRPGHYVPIQPAGLDADPVGAIRQRHSELTEPGLRLEWPRTSRGDVCAPVDSMRMRTASFRANRRSTIIRLRGRDEQLTGRILAASGATLGEHDLREPDEVIGNDGGDAQFTASGKSQSDRRLGAVACAPTCVTGVLCRCSAGRRSRFISGRMSACAAELNHKDVERDRIAHRGGIYGLAAGPATTAQQYLRARGAGNRRHARRATQPPSP